MLYIDDIVPVCCVEPGKEEAACVDLDGEWAENSKVPKAGGEGSWTTKALPLFTPPDFPILNFEFFPHLDGNIAIYFLIL